MSVVGLAKPIRDYIDALVHPSVQHDTLAATRHRTFIAPRLFSGCVALAVFPVYLAARGAPSTLEVAIFAWFMAPILVAYFLSHTGKYEIAHLLSAASLAALGLIVGIAAGGIASFAVAWLLVIPLEASLSASRRVFAFALALALTAAALLALLGAVNTLPLSQASTLIATLGVALAALYAAAIALGAQTMIRASFRLRKADADRYRMLSGIMTDTITRHDRSGAILFASPAAEPLFGMTPRDLVGHGLFERVHVADRPAYLTALADSAALGQERSVEFRVRRETIEPARSVQFIWIEMRCQPVDPITKAGDKEREVIAILRDITERKDQERTIQSLRADVEQATAANNTFLSIIGCDQDQTIQRLSSNPEVKVKKSA